MVYGMADSCLYNKQNNTWIYVNTRRYVNSISPRVHLLFSIYRRIRKGQLEYQRAHTIPFRTFQKLMHWHNQCLNSVLFGLFC